MPDERVVDCRGKTVYLTADVWEEHIVVRHPELANRKWLVLQCLARPAEIRQSRRGHQAHVYRLPYPQRDRLFVQVVVDSRTGLVRTAYLTSRPLGGELVWP